MRFDGSRLPESAREVLLNLDAACQESEDAARSAQLRVGNLARTADPKLVQRLNQSAAKHRQANQTLANLCGAIRQWLNSLPPNVVIEAAPVSAAKVREGLTLLESIEQTRDEILSVKTKGGVRSLPTRR